MSAGSDEPSGKQLALDQIDDDVRRKWGSLTPEGVDPEPNTLAEATERAAHGGFIEAEGCITVHVERTDSRQLSHRIRPEFALNHAQQAGFLEGEGMISVDLHKADRMNIGYEAKPIVKANHAKQGGRIKAKLQRILDLAGAENRNVNELKKDDNQDQWRIAISKTGEIKQLLLKLFPWLGHKKKEAEIMLAHVLPIFEQKRHTNKRGFLKVMRHKDRMDEAKPDTSKQKYDHEFFREKWEDDIDAQTRFGEDWGASA